MNKEQLQELTHVLNKVGTSMYASLNGYSQKITIVDAEFTGNEIMVTYKTQEGIEEEIPLEKFKNITGGAKIGIK